MSKPEDYQAIEVWHRRTGSFQYYIDRMQRKAAEENAPLNAIYFRDDQGWVTTDDLHVDHWFHEALKNEQAK